MRIKQAYVLALFFLFVAVVGCKQKRILQRADFSKDTKTYPSNPALDEAHLKVYEGGSHDFGVVPSNQTREIRLTLFNEGIKNATDIILDRNLSAPFAFKNGAYPGQGGSCGASLAPEASCDLVVTYRPTAGGNFSDYFRLSYDSELEAKEYIFAVRGHSGVSNVVVDEPRRSNCRVQDVPLVENCPSTLSVLDFPNTLIGESETIIVKLKNIGELPAKMFTDAGVLESPFHYAGGAYPGVGGTCAWSLDVGASCTVVLSFVPDVAGPHMGTWGMAYFTGVAPNGVSLFLTGQSGTAVLGFVEGESLNFANVSLSVPTTRTIRLRNSGNFVATNIESEMSGDFEFAGGTYPGTGGNCTDTLNPATTCQIVVAINREEVGNKTGKLDLEYYDGEAIARVEFAFVGRVQGAILESVETYNFFRTAKGTVKETEIEISNVGNLNATGIVSSSNPATPFRYRGTAYPGIGGTCSNTLAVGASCKIVLQYMPTGTGTGLQAHSSFLNLNYNDGTSTQPLRIDLVGQAGLGSLTFSGNATAWGIRALGTQQVATVTVTNNGSYDVSDMAGGEAFAHPFSWADTGAYPGASGTCGTELSPGGSCSLRVRYSPDAMGLMSDTLTIDYNNGFGTTSATRALSGTGSLAALTLDLGNAYNFGQVSHSDAVGTVVLTIANPGAVGGVQATAFTRTGLTSPFSIQEQTCSSALSSGAACTVTLRYAPQAIGFHTSNLNISYYDGQSTQTMTFGLQGEGINSAPISTAPTPIDVPVDDAGQMIVLPATDPNGDNLTYYIDDGPTNGSLGVVVGNTVVYTPSPGYAGSDSFSFRVHDGTNFSNVSTVNINVN